MTRDECIAEMSRLLAGLALPVSIGVPTGAVKAPWGALHDGLIGFGWATAEQYEARLRDVLGGTMCPDSPDGRHADSQQSSTTQTWLECSYCHRRTGYTPKV